MTARALRSGSRLLLLAIGMLLTLAIGLSPLAASPYDDHSARPGDVLTNSMTVTSEFTDDVLTATDLVQIGHFDFPAELYLLGLDPGGTALWVPQSEYADSAGALGFSPMPAPRDTAGDEIDLTQAPISLSPVSRALAGMPLFLEFRHQGFNIDPGRRDVALLEISDAMTGDVEILRLQETAQDSGIFRAGITTSEGGGALHDGILSTLPRSVITARFSDAARPDRTLSSTVFIGPFDPAGLVFDSRSGLPLDDVKVTLIDTSTGLPAKVYGDDLTSDYPATILTGSSVEDSSGAVYDLPRGEYRFPFVAPGTYRFEIEAPLGFTAPSLASDVDLQTLPGAPFALSAASRLEPFTLTAGLPPRSDIPLDGDGFITVIREGSDDALELGDHIQYSVRVSTNLDRAVSGDIHDTLDPGLRVVEDSLKVDGERSQKTFVISEDGRELELHDLEIPAGRSVLITYVALVSPAANPGATLVSSTRASAARLLSNTALHELEILDTFGTGHDILLGQIRADACGANAPAPADLSGIRVLLEDGRYALTDRTGRFSFRQVARGGHAVVVDPLTLPRGWQLALCEPDTRKAGSAQSQFVEARGGFARQVIFNLAPGRFLDHPDAIPPISTSSSDFDAEWLEQQHSPRGFVFPPQDHLPRGRSIDVIAARAEGQTFTLSLNSEEVSPLARRPSMPGRDGETVLDIWKGIGLKEGVNLLELTLLGKDGQEVSRQVRRVLFNDNVARIEVVDSESVLESDGRKRPVVTLRISNAEGIPLHPGTLARVMVDPPHRFSRIVSDKDGKHEERGSSITATVDPDGLVRLRLAAPDRPGKARFQVLTRDGQARAEAMIISRGQPWVLAGIAGGTLAESQIADKIQTEGDTRLGGAGSATVFGRGSFYARGVIDEDWLLTLRYDSARADERGDFDGTLDDQDKSVIGDDGREGDGAASRDPLFLRLEGEPGEFLYGDFNTAMTVGATRYDRRLTGARTELGAGRFDIEGFITGSDQRYVRDAFAADGTSGPFQISQDGILAYSETVSIETTDRDDAGHVLDKVTLKRGSDYDINYVDGRIFLRDPLAARDAALNSHAIIVEYELEDEHSAGITAGGRLVYSPHADLSIGGTLIHEDNTAGSDGTGDLAGLDADWQLSDTISAKAGFALSRQEASNKLAEDMSGHSGEMRLTYASEYRHIETWLRSESTAFGVDNQADTDETVVSGGLDTSWRLGEPGPSPEAPSLSFESKLRREVNLDTDEETTKGEIALSQSEDTRLLRGGLRAVTRTQGSEDGRTLKAFVLREVETPEGRLRYAYGLEGALLRSGVLDDPDRASASAEWDASERLMLKLTSEIVHDDEIDAAILGASADVDIWEGGTLRFGALEAVTSAGAHLVGKAGLEQGFDISPGTRLRFTLDRQQKLAGGLDDTGPIREAGLSNPDLQEAYTAAGIGIELDRGPWRHDGFLELRRSSLSEQARLRFGSARPLSASLEIEAHGSLFGSDSRDGDFERDHEIGGSLAWRPEGSNLVLLERMDLRHDAEPGIRKTRLVNSVYLSRRLSGGHELNLRHGIKLGRFAFDGDAYDDLLNLAGAEYRHRIGAKLDLGIHGTALHSLHTGARQQSLGASIGLTPFDNGWLAVGYNVSGFHDDDFSRASRTEKGFFLQFRMKFDAGSLAR